jgi:hypothetical protein
MHCSIFQEEIGIIEAACNKKRGVPADTQAVGLFVTSPLRQLAD